MHVLVVYLLVLGGEVWGVGRGYFLTSVSPNLPNSQQTRERMEKWTIIDLLWKTRMMPLLWKISCLLTRKCKLCNLYCWQERSISKSLSSFGCSLPTTVYLLPPTLVLLRAHGLICSISSIFISKIAPYFSEKPFHPVQAEGITLLS